MWSGRETLASIDQALHQVHGQTQELDAEIQRAVAVGADLGERVEHQHHVGVALTVMLGDVERAEPQRGAPVHLADPVARHELTDVAGLDPLAERG